VAYAKSTLLIDTLFILNNMFAVYDANLLVYILTFYYFQFSDFIIIYCQIGQMSLIDVLMVF